MFLRNAVLTATTLLFTLPAQAGGIPLPGDFYLISRDPYGTFVGSHKLYMEYSNGLKQVRYCKRDYYVRSLSVAWTHTEADRGNVVQIEFNFGKGWRPICGKPQDQVALKDLGIDMLPHEFINQARAEAPPESRLSKISGVFSRPSAGSRYKSYHTR